MKEKQTTDFGYQEVPVAEKESKVAAVFSSVAKKYDIMNDLMSLGIHRLWKRAALSHCHVKPDHKILDLAGGTGDLSLKFAKQLSDEGQIVLADINAQMLHCGRDRMLNLGITDQIQYAQVNGEQLPFPDNYFDYVTLAFGLRNMTHKDRALKSIYRVLKPGGKLLVLEFSTPTFPGLKPIYDAYSFSILPKIGKLVTNDEASYQYLAESIRRHPDQETLKQMMLDCGFDECHYYNYSGGITALHVGYKY